MLLNVSFYHKDKACWIMNYVYRTWGELLMVIIEFFNATGEYSTDI